MLFLQLQQFLKQLVVFIVCNQRIVKLVIAVRMKVDLLTQFFDFFSGIFRHLFQAEKLVYTRFYCFLRGFGKQLAALRYIFMLVFIDKNKDRILGLIGHLRYDIGHSAAYFFLLLFVEFAGNPDVDIWHNILQLLIII
jgi:hypothetical protein